MRLLTGIVVGLAYASAQDCGCAAAPSCEAACEPSCDTGCDTGCDCAPACDTGCDCAPACDAGCGGAAPAAAEPAKKGKGGKGKGGKGKKGKGKKGQGKKGKKAKKEVAKKKEAEEAKKKEAEEAKKKEAKKKAAAEEAAKKAAEEVKAATEAIKLINKKLVAAETDLKSTKEEAAKFAEDREMWVKWESDYELAKAATAKQLAADELLIKQLEDKLNKQAALTAAAHAAAHVNKVKDQIEKGIQCYQAQLDAEVKKADKERDQALIAVLGGRIAHLDFQHVKVEDADDVAKAEIGNWVTKYLEENKCEKPAKKKDDEDGGKKEGDEGKK